MNRKIAKFEFVSEKIARSHLSFNQDTDTSETYEKNILSKIALPKRATIQSAGYDFYSPLSFTLRPSENIIIPTFVRCKMEKGWMLAMFPRSGLGFKYHIMLANTVGIIDADYYHSSNEGHIMIKLVNSHKDKVLEVKQGDAIAQGIFIPHGITIDDTTTEKRDGGFGSTDKK